MLGGLFAFGVSILLLLLCDRIFNRSDSRSEQDPERPMRSDEAICLFLLITFAFVGVGVITAAFIHARNEVDGHTYSTIVRYMNDDDEARSEYARALSDGRITNGEHQAISSRLDAAAERTFIRSARDVAIRKAGESRSPADGDHRPNLP